MEREAEIEQIQRELTILQARYSLYCRLGRFWRGIFIVLTLGVAVGSFAFAIKLFLFDILYGVFFVGAALLFTVVVIWFIKWSDLRWIDVASPYFRDFYSPYWFYPELQSHRKIRSEAEFIERQMADRETRLSELGVSTPRE
jgi:hypothetical protein